MKRILFLGGSHMQTSAIKHANEKGYYTICTDYLDDAPGKKIAAESYNISTTNKEEVLSLAKRLSVDAVIAYASDPASSTASYVSNKLNLVSNSCKSVSILANKDKFRKFLQDNNFKTPEFAIYSNAESLKNNYNPKKKIVLKPVDSSGSKGVSVVDNVECLDQAFQYAISYSRSNKVIAEDFVLKSGYQVAGDGFVYEGKLVFRCFANEHFNKVGNSLVPIGESFPYFNSSMESKVHDEIQRFITLSGIEYGPLNFDIRIYNNEVYLMEIGPRNGGNLIPEVIKYHTGVDLISGMLEVYVENKSPNLGMEESNKGFYASYMIHSNKSGVLEEIKLENSIKDNIVEFHQWLPDKSIVEEFSNASKLVGAIVLKFNSMEEMLSKMDNMNLYVNVLVK